MEELKNIHAIAQALLRQSFPLEPVKLKHQMPVRPPRALGLVNIKGEVFHSEKISRMVFLRISLPIYLTIHSMFIRPKWEYDLPVFATEVVTYGKRRMVITDIHRSGINTDHDDEALFDRMTLLRNGYPDLNAHAMTLKGKIQTVFSRAAFLARLPNNQKDDQILALFKDYLDLFSSLLREAAPLDGERRHETERAYQDYLRTVVDHDPGVKGFKKLFGAKEGMARAMNLHFEDY